MEGLTLYQVLGINPHGLDVVHLKITESRGRAFRCASENPPPPKMSVERSRIPAERCVHVDPSAETRALFERTVQGALSPEEERRVLDWARGASFLINIHPLSHD